MTRNAGLLAGWTVFAALDRSARANAIGPAWQDGADLAPGTNDIRCNGSDEPRVDQGLEVPDPPEASMLP